MIASAFLTLALVLLCAIGGQAVAPYTASHQDLGNTFAAASLHHPLGTDSLGRDVLSRIIVGARSAVIGPAAIAFGAMFFGTLLGVFAGYTGGFVETLIMRWVDLMFAVPQLLIAIVVVGVLKGTYWQAVMVLIVLTTPVDTRLIRGATLEQRGAPYVEALRVLGVSRARIMFWHIWPTLLPLSIAQTTLNFAASLVTLAALSFLGIGVAPGSADWGRMLAEGREVIVANPWCAMSGGFVIAATAASVSILGDWLYERLNDRTRA